MELSYESNKGFVDESGVLLEIGPNLSNRMNHNVYVEVRGDAKDSSAKGEVFSIVGEREIKAVLYEIAYAGGLIDEDGELVITKPSERVIPEDGLYTHEHWAGGKSYVVVKDGRLFVPQVDKNGQVYEDGSVLEMTDEYLESNNDLVPVKLGV